MTLTTINPKQKRQPALIKPASGGLLERAVVVGGGVVVLYTTAATLPIASVAAVIGMGAYFLDEIKKFRPKEEGDELQEILSASTPKHPSINDLRAQLKKRYDVAAINRAIEGMLGQTAWIQFSPKDKHPLAKYGEVYCWIDPHDPMNVMLPIQRLEQLLDEWGIEAKDAGPDLPQFQWAQSPRVVSPTDPTEPVEAPQYSPAPEEVSPPFPQWDESLGGWQPTDLPQEFIPYLASQIHILIAATTGSGKTWVLRNLCTHLANRGDLLCIADPKGTQWGDLTPASKFMQTGDEYLRLFDHLNSELNRRRALLSQGKPVGRHLWVVLDEWFLVQAEAKVMENADRVAMENLLVKLIAAGRELNLHLIMVGQSHLLGDLSLSGGKNTFSSGLRDSICVLALGCKETTDHAGKPMVGSAKTIEGVLTDQYLIKNKSDRDAAQHFHSALRRQPSVNRTYCIYSSQLFIGQTPDLTIPNVTALATFPETAPAVAPETMSEVKQLILAILEHKGNAPMLASEIRQQSAALKKLTTEQVAFALDRMAVDDGFVVSDGGTPPRYQIPGP